MKNLELYVHIPFCVKKCHYCDFLSFACDDRTQKQYVASLISEIKAHKENFAEYSVSTIFFGGGTPSWLQEDLLLSILSEIRRNFHVMEDAEISIECNPGTVTQKKLQLYKQAGINRLSIGLQSTKNEELKMLGRIHTFEQFMKTYEMARAAGFTNINIDLISGLPYQTAEVFTDSLRKVIRLRPEHVSVYTLIVEKGTPFYDAYKFDAVKQEAGMETEVLPNEDEVYRIYKLTQKLLVEAGYKQYEISNYAKPDFECQHNIGYWKRKEYLGLGLGASSLVQNVRFSNTSDLYTYIEGDWLDEESIQNLTRKEQMEEFFFLGLRMPEGVLRREFEEMFAMPPEAIYQTQMEELKEQELLQVKEGRICLTDKGLDLSNYAMAKFLQE